MIHAQVYRCIYWDLRREGEGGRDGERRKEIEKRERESERERERQKSERERGRERERGKGRVRERGLDILHQAAVVAVHAHAALVAEHLKVRQAHDACTVWREPSATLKR